MQTLKEHGATVGQDGSCWKIVLRGVVFGALRALIGTILYVAFFLVYEIFTMETSGVFGKAAIGWYELWASVLILSGAVLVGFLFFVLVPSTVGGGVVTWILLTLDRSHKLSLGLSLAVGCFIGSAAGLAVVGLSSILLIPETARGFVEEWPFTVGAAILVGAWHSWCMARWFLHRPQSQSKDQTVSEG